MNFEKLGLKWIWNDGNDTDVNQYSCFRKTFNLEKTEEYFLYICADTDYVAEINGEVVGFGTFKAYPQNKFYDKIDVSKYLKVGENTIDILAYYQGVSTYSYVKGEPGLIFGIIGENTVITNDGTLYCNKTGYKNGEIMKITRQLGPSFLFDANKKDYTEFYPAHIKNYSKYLPAEVPERPVLNLDTSNYREGKRKTQGVFMYQREGRTLAEKVHNSYMAYEQTYNLLDNDKILRDNSYHIYDLGKETSGYLTFEIEATEGTEFIISWGEHLEDLRVSSFINIGGYFTCKYIAKAGINKFTAYFRRIGCRYLQVNISNMKSPCRIISIGVNEAIYPAMKAKSFEIKDRLLREIDKICIETLKQSAHEHFEDCPWREQGLYAMDARIQALCGYYVFGTEEYYRFVRASLDLIASSMRDDGFIDVCAPADASIDGKTGTAIPCFSFIWIVWVCEYVKLSGDLKSGEKYYEKIKYMLGKYIGMFEGGLYKNSRDVRYWHFYDWEDFLAGMNPAHSRKFDDFYIREFDAPSNMFLYYALKSTQELEKALGKAEKFVTDSFLQEYKENINKSFYSPENKRYYIFKNEFKKDFEAQLVQSLALICGFCPDEESLRKDLAKDKTMIPVTLSASVFKYDALLKDEKYLEEVLDEIAEIWGGMLKKGATTFFETAKGADDFNGSGSLCHGWSSVPAYIFRKYMKQ